MNGGINRISKVPISREGINLPEKWKRHSSCRKQENHDVQESHVAHERRAELKKLQNVRHAETREKPWGRRLAKWMDVICQSVIKYEVLDEGAKIIAVKGQQW